MPPAAAKKLARDIPPFRAPYAPLDEAIAAELLASASRGSDVEARIDARATRLVKAIRARTGGLGGVEDFLHAYALSTKEGLALMVLAEALLRVPDAETADRLIGDEARRATGRIMAHARRLSWCRPRPGPLVSRSRSFTPARPLKASSMP